MTDDLKATAEALIAAYAAAGKMVATAESCTGGLIAATLTAVSGSSSVVDRGFVTYSNEAKHEMLGVPLDMTYGPPGAVSEEVARLMAEGALSRSRGHAAVAVTGIAGPTGGTPEKPVGLVHLACAVDGGQTFHRREIFEGDRDAVRRATVAQALEMLRDALDRP